MKAAELGVCEQNIAAIKGELDLLYKKQNEIEEKKRHADARRMQRSYEKQYLEMCHAVAEEEAALESLMGFFAGGVPTQDELDGAKELDAKARAALSMSEGNQPGELSELEAFFANEVSEQAIKNATENAAKETELRAEINRLSDEQKRLKEEISGSKSYSESELDTLIKDVNSSKKANVYLQKTARQTKNRRA